MSTVDSEKILHISALKHNKKGYEHLYINGKYPTGRLPTEFQKKIDTWKEGYRVACLIHNLK